MPRKKIADYIESAPIPLPQGQAIIVTTRRTGDVQWTHGQAGRRVWLRAHGRINLRPYAVKLVQNGETIQHIDLARPKLTPARTPILVQVFSILAALIMGFVWKKQAGSNDHEQG